MNSGSARYNFHDRSRYLCNFGEFQIDSVLSWTLNELRSLSSSCARSNRIIFLFLTSRSRLSFAILLHSFSRFCFRLTWSLQFTKALFLFFICLDLSLQSSSLLFFEWIIVTSVWGKLQILNVDHFTARTSFNQYNSFSQAFVPFLSTYKCEYAKSKCARNYCKTNFLLIHYLKLAKSDLSFHILFN